MHVLHFFAWLDEEDPVIDHPWPFITVIHDHFFKISSARREAALKPKMPDKAKLDKMRRTKSLTQRARWSLEVWRPSLYENMECLGL